MEKRHFATFLVSCSLFVSTLAVTWKDCGSKVGAPTQLTVAGCESAGTCQLHKGVNVTFEIDFKSKEDATGLKMLVYGHIAGVDVPFPIDNPDACKDSGITCPVKNGQDYSYHSYIFVKTEYPSLSLVVKLKLVDQSSNVLVCVVMPVQITSAPKALSSPMGRTDSKSNSILRFLKHN